jgi:hypothetical protein
MLISFFSRETAHRPRHARLGAARKVRQSACAVAQRALVARRDGGGGDSGNSGGSASGGSASGGGSGSGSGGGHRASRFRVCRTSLGEHYLNPHGCKHPQTKQPVKVRYGYYLVTDRLKANQGKKSQHKHVKATIIHHFNTYTSITATKAKPFPDGKQADILRSGITTIDNPAARNWLHDVTSTNPIEVTNQEFINRAALGHQPGPEEHDPRNDVITSAKRADPGTRPASPSSA